jgi:hypothetical protein
LRLGGGCRWLLPWYFHCHRSGLTLISVEINSRARSRASLSSAQSAHMDSSLTVCSGCTSPCSQGCIFLALVDFLGPFVLSFSLRVNRVVVDNSPIVFQDPVSNFCATSMVLVVFSCVLSCVSDTSSRAVFFAKVVAFAQYLTGVEANVE